MGTPNNLTCMVERVLPLGVGEKQTCHIASALLLPQESLPCPLWLLPLHTATAQASLHVLWLSNHTLYLQPTLSSLALLSHTPPTVHPIFSCWRSPSPPPASLPYHLWLSLHTPQPAFPILSGSPFTHPSQPSLSSLALPAHTPASLPYPLWLSLHTPQPAFPILSGSPFTPQPAFPILSGSPCTHPSQPSLSSLALPAHTPASLPYPLWLSLHTPQPAFPILSGSPFTPLQLALPILSGSPCTHPSQPSLSSLALPSHPPTCSLGFPLHIPHLQLSGSAFIPQPQPSLPTFLLSI